MDKTELFYKQDKTNNNTYPAFPDTPKLLSFGYNKVVNQYKQFSYNNTTYLWDTDEQYDHILKQNYPGYTIVMLKKKKLQLMVN